MHQRRRLDAAAAAGAGKSGAAAALKKAAAAKAAARRHATDPWTSVCKNAEDWVSSANVMYVSLGVLLVGLLAEVYAINHALRIPKLADEFVPAFKVAAVPMPGTPRHIIDYSARAHTPEEFGKLITLYGARGLRSYTLFLYAELIGVPCIAFYLFVTSARLMVASKTRLFLRAALVFPILWWLCETLENVAHLDASLAHPAPARLPDAVHAFVTGTVGWLKWKLLAAALVSCLIAKRSVFAEQMLADKEEDGASSKSSKDSAKAAA